MLENIPPRIVKRVEEAKKDAAKLMADHPQVVARRVLSSLDLTYLPDQPDADAVKRNAESIAASLRQVRESSEALQHTPAAICTWVEHLPLIDGLTKCTVTVFPSGKGTVDSIFRETIRALRSGAGEIDTVMNHVAFKANPRGHDVISQLYACRDEIYVPNKMKIILEAGSYRDASLLRDAAKVAIDCNPDFLKTDTGKLKDEQGKAFAATPETVAILLEVAETRRNLSVGVKASSGIRTLNQAAVFLALAEQTYSVVTPKQFRIGASQPLYEEIVSLLRPANVAANQRTAPKQALGGY